MNPTKVIAFFLGLASLTLLLLFGFVAFAGPPVLGAVMPPPWPLDQLSSGCLGLALFATAIPVAAVPGLAGLSLWWLVVRKKEATENVEAMAGPEREASFQARLDGLTLRLLECGGDAAALAAEIPIWTWDLDAPQQSRLLRLLAACGSDGSGPVSTSRLSVQREDIEAPGWGTRALSLGLLAFAAFCALWGALVAFSVLSTQIAKPLGFNPGPGIAVYGSGSCFVVALAALLGGLALRWLTRRETHRLHQLTATRQRTSDIALESCLRRLESLLKGPGPNHPSTETGVRLARAHIVCGLPELDGAGKGRLIARLHSGGLLSRLALFGADLRGAELAGFDLSAAALAGANLSGANLSRARLVQADLHGSQLQRADLRGADAEGADLRHADLRQARMHRCNLRQADLRGADLRETNLWRADLAGAQVDEVRSGQPVNPQETRP
jgi:uncharacterized protein YjbI with pentapeptide repeats